LFSEVFVFVLSVLIVFGEITFEGLVMVEGFGAVIVDFILVGIPKSFEFPLLVVGKNVLNGVQ
jgi:hypothetical protein